MRFGAHRLVAELGSGGMGEVFLASRDAQGGARKLEVLKIVRKELASDPSFATMLVDEGRIAMRLNHPNVVQTNDVGLVDGRYYLTMEFLEGEPLTELLRLGREDIPIDVLCLVISDLLGGLEYAHNLADIDGTPLRIVHRDVSPHNVFVTYDGQVKLVDFGIAKAERRIGLTEPGDIKGKLRYMAPEQLRGVEVDGRVDLFSAGIVLWEAVTQKRFWARRDDIQIIGALMGELPSLDTSAVVGEIPRGLVGICAKALEPDLEHRYASARAFKSDVDDYLRSRDVMGLRAQLVTLMEVHFGVRRDRVRALLKDHFSKADDDRPFDAETDRPGATGATLVSLYRPRADSDPELTDNANTISQVVPSLVLAPQPAQTALAAPQPAPRTSLASVARKLIGPGLLAAAMVIGLSVVVVRLRASATHTTSDAAASTSAEAADTAPRTPVSAVSAPSAVPDVVVETPPALPSRRPGDANPRSRTREISRARVAPSNATSPSAAPRATGGKGTPALDRDDPL